MSLLGPIEWSEQMGLAGGRTVADIAAEGLVDVPVICPHRLVDHEAGRVVAGTGDVVPWATAVRFGLVQP